MALHINLQNISTEVSSITGYDSQYLTHNDDMLKGIHSKQMINSAAFFLKHHVALKSSIIKRKEDLTVILTNLEAPGSI
jgi:flagellar biosynthesis chaperone FliJ